MALPGSDEDKKRFATPIPDNQIERLKFLLENAENKVTLERNLQVGDVVRIESGPLKGLECSVLSIKGQTKFYISIDLFGGVSVDVSQHDFRFIR